MFTRMRGVALSSLLAVSFQAPAGAQESLDLGKEARAFMASYERDLVAHDAEGIIARYDPRGAVILVNGQGGARTMEQVAEVYRTAWRGPLRFSWKDVTYEALTHTSVMVRGTFLYQAVADGPDLPFTYVAVLTWDGQALRIAFEMETQAHSTAPEPM